MKKNTKNIIITVFACVALILIVKTFITACLYRFAGHAVANVILSIIGFIVTFTTKA